MKKRMVSLLCVLALCLGMLPVTALAAEGAPSSLYVGNYQITSGDTPTYLKAGTAEGNLAEGSENDWTVKYEPSTATLTLSGASIKGGSNTGSAPFGSGIYAKGSSNQSVALTIELIGTNTITGYYGIYVNAEISADSNGTDASLTITGEKNGSLEVSGSNHGIFVKSGTGNASLNIEKATVTSNTNNSYAAGVNVQSSANATGSPNISLSVNGGSLIASGGGNNDGIQFYVGSPQATGAITSLTVTDHAIVDARNGGISASRISETLPTPTPTDGNSSGIVFDGKNGTVYGEVELQEDIAIGEGESLTIPGGSSLNANGKLTNDGTINVESGGTVSGSLSGGTAVTTPNITGQPTDNTVTEEEKTEFSVTASDAQTYQWQESTDNGQNWADISGANAASYTTSSTTTSMNGYQYRCVVKNTSGVSVTSDAATLTVTAKPVYTVTVNTSPAEGGTVNADKQTAAEAETVTLTATPNSNYRFTGWTSVGGGAFADASSPSTTFTMPAGDVTITANWQYDPPYIPPTKTPSEKALDKIEDAQPGDTVTISISGRNTKLDKEVFEALAEKNVILQVELPSGVTWTVNGQDIPENADLTDIDMGVSMNTNSIPVDVLKVVTGEIGTVQITLKQNGAFGFTITLTAPLGTDNKGLWANLYHYNEADRKMTFETAAKVSADGSVSLPFTHASAYAIVLDEKSHELPFIDTVKGAWYQEAVEYVYRKGIMNGVSATAFKPGATLSRAMVAQILYNLEGQPAAEGESTFTDVRGHWAASPIAWAQERGVLNGYEDNTFRPDRAVSREELAQMLYNYAKYKGYDLTAAGDFAVFPDGDDVSDWAEVAMEWANGMGLINGFEDNTLLPGGTATRAQAAVMLAAFSMEIAK
jgi:uncharacterized repeat protein (TIGR02543 family)